MLTVDQMKVFTRPLKDETCAMVLAWMCKDGTIQQVVAGNALDMSTLVASAIGRIEEITSLSTDKQLEVIKYIIDEAKKIDLSLPPES